MIKKISGITLNALLKSTKTKKEETKHDASSSRINHPNPTEIEEIVEGEVKNF